MQPSCGHLQLVDTALNTSRQSVREYCLINRPVGGKCKAVIRIAGLIAVDEEYVDAIKGICNVVINAANLEENVQAPVKLNDDAPQLENDGLATLCPTYLILPRFQLKTLIWRIGTYGLYPLLVFLHKLAN